MDRISNLPNEVICHIVSFLSAKEAVFTSVLSKKWQNLFTIIIPKLKFDDEDEIQGSFSDFVDGILDLPASTRVRKFSLRCRERADPAQCDLINSCLCDVLKRGVLDIKLDIGIGKHYHLPFEFFTCKTVVKMELDGRYAAGFFYGKGFVVDVLPEDAFLPALETLTLSVIQFNNLRGCAFEKFLSACPVLKELTLFGMRWQRRKWSGKLCSSTLQRLIIKDFHPSQFTRFTLDTPSLTYFECSDVSPDEYSVVNLDSLVEAKLHLQLMSTGYQCHVLSEAFVVHDHDSSPSNLIKGLGSVEIMEISFQDTFDALYSFHKSIPVFEKLYHLTIRCDDEDDCMAFLPYLLTKSPNLEALVIDGPLHYDEERPESVCECLLKYSFLSSCPVKVLQKLTTAERMERWSS
ncbi:F-box domain-containing protein [Hirschfeldia incana]|nr:F-box domain-containing protein [Hirschfeldia incana]